MKRPHLLGFWALLFLLAGCGGGEDYGTPVQVTGKVTLDDKPLEGATVIFHNMEGLPAQHRTRQAKTNAEGVYTLEEVYPAEYQVSVQKFSDVDPATAPAAAVAPTDPLAKYTSQESPLSATVSPDKTTFNFPLTSK